MTCFHTNVALFMSLYLTESFIDSCATLHCKAVFLFTSACMSESAGGGCFCGAFRNNRAQQRALPSPLILGFGLVYKSPKSSGPQTFKR